MEGVELVRGENTHKSQLQHIYGMGGAKLIWKWAGLYQYPLTYKKCCSLIVYHECLFSALHCKDSNIYYIELWFLTPTYIFGLRLLANTPSYTCKHALQTYTHIHAPTCMHINNP